MRYLSLAILVLNISIFSQTEVERLIKSSEEFSRRDQFAEAAEILTKAIALEPNNARLVFKRAEIFYGTAQKEKAVNDLLRAAELAPDDSDMVIRTTNLLNYFEECSASVRILDRFIAKNSKSPEVYFRRATSRSCIDDPFGASDDFLAAVELAPATLSYRSEYLKHLSALGESKRAVESITKLILLLEKKGADPKLSSLHPGFVSDLSNLYRTRALLFHANGETENEFSDLARFVQLDRTYYNYQTRAHIYVEHQMFSEAIADHTEAIRLTTDHAPIVSLLERAEVYVLAEKYAEAVADYEAALKLEGVSNKALLQKRIEEIRGMIN
jgi:tetratricopeptide (TPR) repeat protein